MPATPPLDDTPRDAGDALPVGTRLAEFELRSVLGVGGFVVMLGSVVLAIQSVRRGRNGGELRAVGGNASRRTRSRASLVDRLEERWRRRPEDNS